MNAKPKVSLLSTEPGILEVTRQLEAVAQEAKSFLAPKQGMLGGPGYERGGVLGTLQSVRDT